MSNLTDGLFTVTCDNCSNVFSPENKSCSCGKRKGRLHLDYNKFLNRIYDNATDVDYALDLIFETFHHIWDRHEMMNEILARVDVAKLDETLMIGFMCQTFKYSEQVPNHSMFAQRVVNQLHVMGLADEEIQDVCFGLWEVGDFWNTQRWELISGPRPNL